MFLICMNFEIRTAFLARKMLKERSLALHLLSVTREKTLFPKCSSTSAPLVANVSFHLFRTRLIPTRSRQVEIFRRIAGWQLSGYPAYQPARIHHTALFHFRYAETLSFVKRNGRSRSAIACTVTGSKTVSLCTAIDMEKERAGVINGRSMKVVSYHSRPERLWCQTRRQKDVSYTRLRRKHRFIYFFICSTSQTVSRQTPLFVARRNTPPSPFNLNAERSLFSLFSALHQAVYSSERYVTEQEFV